MNYPRIVKEWCTGCLAIPGVWVYEYPLSFQSPGHLLWNFKIKISLYLVNPNWQDRGVFIIFINRHILIT